MPSYKKGVLYLILFFVIAWMFILGVFVGRGSAPVKFDTRDFQKRLANIAGEYEILHKDAEETDIQFYEDLKTPMQKAGVDQEKQSSVTRRIDNPARGDNPELKPDPRKVIPLKLSQKSLTKKQYALKPVKSDSGAKKVSKINKKTEILPVSKTKNYTIQIAAFRDSQAAIDKISSLKAKGHNAYRMKGQVQNETWYRVRIGHFPTTEVARKYLRKLKNDNINGIIIKQDS